MLRNVHIAYANHIRVFCEYRSQVHILFHLAKNSKKQKVLFNRFNRFLFALPLHLQALYTIAVFVLLTIHFMGENVSRKFQYIPFICRSSI